MKKEITKADIAEVEKNTIMCEKVLCFKKYM